MIRIFFSKSNGNILVITSGTTTDQDLSMYKELQNDDMDFTELDNGTSLKDFSTFKSYKINLDTKKLEVTYYTQEELNEIKINNEKQQEVLNRINTILQYSNLDKSSISDLENYILQREKDRIIGGVK
jgi:hypothetical protein